MTYKSDLGVMAYGAGAGPHALTRAGGYTYTYDANGNMSQGKNKTLSYDIENRLTEVNELGTITSFTYDGDGGRVRKTTDDGRGTTASVTYVGALFEIDSSGKTTKHIFAGANRACSVTKDEARGTKDASYYHSDHLGSSSVITDASGNQVEHYEYTPYGTTAVSEITSRPSSLIHHKFTGKELDSTGLYFYGARYYDPELGRFITADTIVQAPYDPQSLNRYAYCRNNPINYVDPTGHFFEFLIWTIIIIAAGWAADKYLNAEVNVGGGVSVPFDTGPSSRSKYSSSNPYPSTPQASNAGTSSNASSSDSSTGINQNLPNTSELITQDNQATNDGVASSLNRSYGSEASEQISTAQPDNFQLSIDLEQAQAGAAGAISAGKFILGRIIGATGTYYNYSYVKPFNKYAPLWRGATRATNTLSTIQALGVALDATGFIDIMQSAALRGVPTWKGQVAIGVHTTAMITKVLGAAGGAAFGATIVAGTTALTGSAAGAVAGVLIVGGAVAMWVDHIEGAMLRKLGVK